MPKINSFIDNYALTSIVISYLLCPYPIIKSIGSITSIVAICLIIYAFVVKKRIEDDRVVSLLLFAFFLINSISLFQDRVVMNLFRAYCMGLLTFTAVYVYSTPKSLMILVRALCIWGVASFIVMVAQTAIGDIMYMPLYFGYYGGITKESFMNFRYISNALGFNLSKSQLGVQISFIIPLVALYVMRQRSYRVLLLYAVSLAGVMVLSFSRAGWMGIIVSCIILFAIRPTIDWQYKQYFKIVFVAAAVIIVLALFDTRIRKCFYSPNQEYSYFTTQDLVLQAFNIQKKTDETLRSQISHSALFENDYTLFGKGIGKTRFATGQKQISLHVTYIQILLDNGIFGQVVFVSLITITLIRLYRGRNMIMETDIVQYQSILLASFISILVYGGFHEILPDRSFWIILGLTSASVSKKAFKEIDA
ncbi:MAG: O-antigen ligase family protein [Nitrospirae bacterium]|nr:O-antigen ligase family protein [Nitrospirota bacterium]